MQTSLIRQKRFIVALPGTRTLLYSKRLIAICRTWVQCLLITKHYLLRKLLIIKSGIACVFAQTIDLDMDGYYLNSAPAWGQ